MTDPADWSWKLQEAVDRIRTRYEHIGRKTGAPFLAVVYPPEAEAAVLKEWRTQISALGDEYDVRTIDVLDATMSVVSDLGAENIVESIHAPMPGSNPETELGNMWVDTVTEKVSENARRSEGKKVVVVLERLGALYPATGPAMVMRRLWDSQQAALEGPVIVLIPGTLVDRRVYSFVNQTDEFMYRGDIL